MNQRFKWFVLRKFSTKGKENFVVLFFLFVLKHDPSVIIEFIHCNFDMWIDEYVLYYKCGLCSVKKDDTMEILQALQKKFSKELAKIP